MSAAPTSRENAAEPKKGDDGRKLSQYHLAQLISKPNFHAPVFTYASAFA